MKKIENKKFSKKILLALGILIIIAGGLLVLIIKNNSTGRSVNDPSSSTNTGTKLNLDPPTKTDLEETDQHKQKIIEEQKNPPQYTKSTITPVITFAEQYEGQVEVGVYIAGVYESGGTCTLTLVNRSSKITKQGPGLKDVKTTRCESFTVPRSEFPRAGSWSVQVSYQSNSGSGTSEAKTVEVR